MVDILCGGAVILINCISSNGNKVFVILFMLLIILTVNVNNFLSQLERHETFDQTHYFVLMMLH